MSKNEIQCILKDAQKTYELAGKYSINKIILKKPYFLWGSKEYECINIL